MGDLKSPVAICFKGILFLLTGVLAGGLLLWRAQSLTTTALFTITVWSFCRFYYFVFYVIEKYVDSEFKYAGLTAFLLMRTQRHR